MFFFSLTQWIRIDFVGCYTVLMVIWLILWFSLIAVFFLLLLNRLFRRRSFWSLLSFIALMHLSRSCACIFFLSSLCLYSYLCSLCSCVLVHFSLPCSYVCSCLCSCMWLCLCACVRARVRVRVRVCVNLCVLKACGFAWVSEVFICQ